MVLTMVFVGVKVAEVLVFLMGMGGDQYQSWMVLVYKVCVFGGGGVRVVTLVESSKFLKICFYRESLPP